MIFAFAIWAMAALPGAACGRVYAYMTEQDETVWMVACAVIPPVAMFCGATLLLKKDEE